MSELIAGLRGLLEQRVGRLWVSGELSNLHCAASGHYYFTLKDGGAQVRAALFRSAARRLPFEPEEGLEVLVFGELSVYEARGDLQLLVRHLEPRGRGALQIAFEQLRARLAAEGLFDPQRKRPLPAIPRCVGVVTSAHGAAIHDVIEVAGQRFPGIPLLLAPTRVQGDGAELEISAALAALAGVAGVDVILLVRGGGSLEDLQPYNSERLARALRACPVPVVSGVGHEVDVTIADLAADVRAPTPSAAAALAIPERSALAARVERDTRRLLAAGRRAFERFGDRHARCHEALRAQAPWERLRTRRLHLEAARRALEDTARRTAERRRARLAACAARLDALSPLAVLGRGYAIVWRAEGGVVRRPSEVAPGDALRIRVEGGELAAQVLARPSARGEEP